MEALKQKKDAGIAQLGPGEVTTVEYHTSMKAIYFQKRKKKRQRP